MNKKIVLILIAIFFILPNSVQAIYSSSYTVKAVSKSEQTNIGTYNNLNDAKKVAKNYDSSVNNVATIYDERGKIVWAKYALVKFNANNSVKLYPYVGNVTYYTSTAANYGIDAAFIDFDDDPNGSDTGMFKLRISGYSGWAVGKYLTIIPISQIGGNTITITGTGVNIRSSYSKSSSTLGTTSSGNSYEYTDIKYADGYTWYQIKYNNTEAWIAYDSSWAEISSSEVQTYYQAGEDTGNLYHYYYSNVNGYGQSWVNLGKCPDILTKGKIYYSFDGNYFYTSLTKMLDDYRNNEIEGSINKDNPYYSYFNYLSTRTKTNLSANDLNAISNKYVNSSSKMYNQGDAFIESQNTYGLNALITYALAINESSFGKSSIAINKNNLFGYAAYDSSTSSAYSFNTVRDGILFYAKTSENSYTLPTGSYYYGSHFGNKGSGKNVKYATDPYWGEKAASHAYTKTKSIDKLDLDYNKYTIGVTKNLVAHVEVYKSPSLSSEKLYTMNHSVVSDNALKTVYNMPVTVLSKIEIDNNTWYKVISEYNINNYGYVLANKFNTSNNAPIINAKNTTVPLGTNYNYLEGVSATDIEDGILDITYDQNVNTNALGTYNITYKATDKNNLTTEKTINVTVEGKAKPTITLQNVEIPQYKQFNYLDGVNATDYIDGKLTNITYDQTVDINKQGSYTVTYKVTNSSNEETTKTRKVTVIENKLPEINADNKQVLLNSTFDYLNNVSATDKEDGTLNVTYSGVVDTSKLGSYTVTYETTDKDNQKATKTIIVEVLEKVLEKKNGNFYLDYLKEINNKLIIQGYQTIIGINNSLNNDIKYKIIMINVNTNNKVEFEALRITKKEEIPKQVYSPDGKDYTYSWFNTEIDIDKLPVGDYKMYISAISDEYYSTSLISNKTYNFQSTSFKNTKNAIISNNYDTSEAFVELKIRDEELIKKTSSYIYNQYTKYTMFEFTEDKKLHIRGNSYSYGSNLSNSIDVNRKLVFENKESYNTYIKDLGSILNGNYKVILPVSDNLDKTKAWFDKTIDISDIPKGDYVIYITTSSNINDISEFSEKLGRNLDEVKTEINSKKYNFTINKNRGNRIELSVK